MNIHHAMEMITSYNRRWEPYLFSVEIWEGSILIKATRLLEVRGVEVKKVEIWPKESTVAAFKRLEKLL